MPELPEMEVYRRHLEADCRGLWIRTAEITRAKSLNVPADHFATEVAGTGITGIDRAGKHLIFHLSNGYHLLNHLMLGGALCFGNTADAPKRSFQVILRFECGRGLHWYGLRLGWLHLLHGTELAARTATLGLDPLAPQFTLAHLSTLLDGRRGALKPLLTDQGFFPGIGNCYSDEICWEARIHPLRTAGTLSMDEQERLWRAMRATLTNAAALGGYSETPFTVDDTISGGYLPHLKVYDRPGAPCLRCGTPISRLDTGERKVFACPACQPEAAQFTAFPMAAAFAGARHGEAQTLGQ